MTATSVASNGGVPSTLVVSQRALYPFPWYSYCVEHEDVVRALFDADLAVIEPKQGRAHRFIADHPRARRLAARAPGGAPYTLTPPRDHYDLVVFIANDVYQLSALESLTGWRELGDRVVLFLNEMWPPWFEDAGLHRLVHGIVDHASHVSVTIGCAAEALRRITDVPVEFVLPTVDTLLAGARVSDDRRIDVANLGRRSPQQHEALVRWTEAAHGLYLFDTAGLATVPDHLEHRRQYYTLVGRSRLFVSNIARFNQPELRRTAREYGLRYVEALAAGALIAGEHPDADAGLGGPGPGGLGEGVRLLDFPIEMAEVPAEVRELVADRDAADEVSRAHRLAAIEHHDVLHRWRRIADSIGVSLGPGADRRAAALHAASDELAGGA